MSYYTYPARPSTLITADHILRLVLRFRLRVPPGKNPLQLHLFHSTVPRCVFALPQLKQPRHRHHIDVRVDPSPCPSHPPSHVLLRYPYRCDRFFFLSARPRSAHCHFSSSRPHSISSQNTVTAHVSVPVTKRGTDNPSPPPLQLLIALTGSGISEGISEWPLALSGLACLDFDVGRLLLIGSCPTTCVGAAALCANPIRVSPAPTELHNQLLFSTNTLRTLPYPLTDSDSQASRRSVASLAFTRKRGEQI